MSSLEERINAVIRNVPDFPKPGIQFKDISTVFLDAQLLQDIVDDAVKQLSDKNVQAVAGIESRGFLLGVPLAMRLGVPFVMVRKAGKLPATTIQETYDLEYGTATIEVHVDAIQKGQNIVIVDDVLATGGTACAAIKLLRKAGATVDYAYFMAELSFLQGDEKIKALDVDVIKTIQYK